MITRMMAMLLSGTLGFWTLGCQPDASQGDEPGSPPGATQQEPGSPPEAQREPGSPPEQPRDGRDPGS
jgi:hypothetical protein